LTSPQPGREHDFSEENGPSTESLSALNGELQAEGAEDHPHHVATDALPTPTAETIKVQISTPVDFSDVYYEIATIKSPYTFQASIIKISLRDKNLKLSTIHVNFNIRARIYCFHIDIIYYTN
jgi:hypothetical protein